MINATRLAKPAQIDEAASAYTTALSNARATINLYHPRINPDPMPIDEIIVLSSLEALVRTGFDRSINVFEL